MSDMADVLAELDAHRPTHAEYTGGWWELACTGCDFAKGRRLSHLDWTPHHAHRAEVFAAALSAAGFGPVKEAKAEALEDAAQHLAQLEYVRPDHPNRAAYEKMLAVRRGNTDAWLKARAGLERSTQ